jgi:hypothetical protein
MFVNRNFDKLAVVLIFVGLFLYASITPVHRLRPEMPKVFGLSPSSWPAEKRAEEARVAQAYWNCVISTIQWKYGFASQLPADPPSEFRIDQAEVGPVAGDPATRARFWWKLKEVWYLPGTWKNGYEWDSSWVSRWPRSAAKNIQDFLGKLTGGS